MDQHFIVPGALPTKKSSADLIKLLKHKIKIV